MNAPGGEDALIGIALAAKPLQHRYMPPATRLQLPRSSALCYRPRAAESTSGQIGVRAGMVSLLKTARTGARSFVSAVGAGLSEHPLAPHPFLRMHKGAQRLRSPQGLFRPAMLTVETVNICNNKCIVCPYTVQTRARKTMPMALFRRIVDEYVSVGGGPISLTPMVGEVFLDRFLPERLELLRSTPGITTISATTNATMARRYDDAKLASMLDAFGRVLVSVYGLDRDEYQTMVLRDDYELMVAQLVRIAALAKPGTVNVGLRLLKHRTDDEVVAWAFDLARRAGVERINVHNSTSEFFNWNHFDVSRPLPHDATWAPVVENTQQCLVPFVAFQALVDGSISFCPGADYEGHPSLALGNVSDTSLVAMLSSDRVRRLWRWDRHGVPELCKTCNFHRPVESARKIKWLLDDPNRYLGA
ncbi:MAG TPA: radical SAM protein [Xanthobacteraceae bacterium]|nr:radical SAM protein [Xanthobacteraceae bacterium]